MTTIVPPIGRGQQGPAVANLHDALAHLLLGSRLPIPQVERIGVQIELRLERIASRYGDFTAKVVSAFQMSEGLPATGDVNARTAEALNRAIAAIGAGASPTPPAAPADQFTVEGRATANGVPVAGIFVFVADLDVRDAQFLGSDATATTDANGNYQRVYDSQAFARAEKGSADLAFILATPTGVRITEFVAADETGRPLTMVEVRNLDPAGPPIVSIPILPNAPTDATVNFEISSAAVAIPSEYDRLLAMLDPLLVNVAPPNTTQPTLFDRIADLNAEDLNFLVLETSVERRKLEDLVAAVRVARDPFGDDLSPAIFYGVALVLDAVDVPALARQSVATLVAALRQTGGFPGQPGDNTIPPFDSQDSLLRAANRVHALATERSLTTSSGQTQASISQTLTVALPAVADQQTLIRTFVNRTGSIPEFWQELRKDSAFQAPGVVEKTQFALQVGAFADQKPTLVSLIQGNAETRSLRDLALDTATLVTLTNHMPPEELADVPGLTPEEKAANYAAQLESKLQFAFPTETVALEVAKLAPPNPAVGAPSPVSDVLLNASDPAGFPEGEAFSVRSTHVDTFFRRYRDQLLSGMPLPEQQLVIGEVKRVQRLFNVSTSPQTFSALLANGVRSAQEIASMPKSAFVDRFSSALGDVATAEYVHGKAMAIGLAATEMAVQVYQAHNDAQPSVTGDGIKELPSWADLFGSVELCDCPHCGSVLGPAAYFVDLLQFLRQSKPNVAGFTPLDVLIGIDGQPQPVGRRPDLAYLQLTCENTDTVLPYVDLVNEVLESYIVQGGKATKDAAHDVGERTTDELLANPQFVQQAAYDLLAAAVYPPGLPFDRALAASREYVASLQTSRHELLRAVVTDDALAWTPPIVAESLGVTAKDYEILTGRLLGGSNSPLVVKQIYGFDPADPTTGGTPLGQLVQQQSVRDVIQRIGVSFAELVDVLGAFFVNPEVAELRAIENMELTDAELQTIVDSNFTNIPPSAQQKLDAAGVSVQQLQQLLAAVDRLAVLFAKGVACDLDETFLQRRDGAALDDAFFTRLSRFVRLWRALGWTVADLDSALRSRGFDADSVVGLRDVAQIRALAARTGMTVSALLSLWSPVESHGADSLYRRLFENRALAAPPDTRLALNVTEDEVAAAQRPNPPLFVDVRSSILAAMRLREAEFELIATDAGFSASTPLNLANLSTVYRFTALSRGAGIPLRLLIELRRLSATDPLGGPVDALAFIDVASRVAARGLSQPQLAYLCRHADVGNLISAAVTHQAQDLNARLLTGLQKFADDAVLLLASPTRDQLHNELALLIHAPADLDRGVDIVEGRSTLSDADKTAFMAAQFGVFLDAATRAQLLPNVTVNPNDPDGPAKAEEQRIARRILVLGPLLDFLQRDFVRQAVADSSGVSAAFQPLLLDSSNVLHSIGSVSRPLLDDFMAPSAVLGEPLASAFVRLRKAVTLLSTLATTVDELSYIAANAADFGNFDLNSLPLTAVDGRVVFALLDALAQYADVRDAARGASIPMIACFTAADAAARATAIAALLGIDEAVVQDVVATLGLADAVIRTTAGMRVVLGLLRLSVSVGVRPSRLQVWAGPPTLAIADEMRDVLKAKYDTQSWLAVARAVSDTLRGAQRAALVAYVMTMPSIAAQGFRDPNQLFEYFLIDVQMDPCMLTSRIKQAISSVQLFVDRCLLNLEQSVAPDAIDRVQWVWRKNYRVWEANRNVFLYPENWIEPELRDDKSPFFKELEAELLQTDVTDDSAQTAIGSYLAKLDEVARLEVCGMYLETGFDDDPSRSILHVIARNLTGAPRKYFYRQLVDDISWTPWQKVDVEIQSTEEPDGSGTQLLPVVWNRRLFLFWLSFAKKSDQPTPGKITGGTVDLSEQQPATYWEIKLTWSLYENGRWMQKRLSNVTVEYPANETVVIGYHWETRSNGSFMVTDYGKATTHVKDDPGSVSQFRVKALATDTSLDLVVLHDLVNRIGVFSLRDRHGDVTSGDASGTENEVLPDRASPTFMGARTSIPLSLMVPASAITNDQNRVSILATPPRPVRVLSASQFSPASLETPHFVDVPGASYFVRSQPTWIWAADYHSQPKYTVPDFVATKTLALAGTQDFSLQTVSRSAALGSAHAWTMAQAALLPSVTQLESASAGASAATVSPLNIGLVGVAAGGSVITGLELGVDVQFNTAFHPYANEFVRRLNYQGVAGLLSLDTQSLGNNYLREPWHPGFTIPASSGDAVCLIEGGFGRNVFINLPGNFELVVREGAADGTAQQLTHFFHLSSNVLDVWHRGVQITDKAITGGCFIERISERSIDAQGFVVPGTFELVVPQSDGLAHYSRFTSNLVVWQANDPVPANTTVPVSLIESDYVTFGTSGALASLELFVVEASAQAGQRQLNHYRRHFLNVNQVGWELQGTVAVDVTGPACAIQSSFKFGDHGRLEVLVLERNPLSRTTQRLVHYWKDDSVAEWQRTLVITDQATGAASFVEGVVRDSATHGNFEVVVPEGAQLAHYWRDNSIPAQAWHRGQVVTTSANASGSLITSHFGTIGHFEVIVPEGPVLKHYFHDNIGPAGTVAERFYFQREYGPSVRVEDPYPRHDVDFTFGSPYGPYNWELFFHVPMTIAMRLFRNQRYTDARDWMHYIFDPTIDSPELTTHRFWRVLPLRDTDTTRIDQMLMVLSSKRPEDAARRAEVEAQIRDWQRNPFQPHRIARMRLGAYKKNAVMKYLDTLIAWGDKLFRQDTIEAINEATQLYVLAANLLGPRPETVRAPGKSVPLTYHDLATSADGLDAFSNALVEVENEFPYSSTLPPVEGSSEAAGLLGVANVFYFCVPTNDKLLSYWDTVEDRLYKVRHCMNIQGVVRQLPLFEPPIDPAMLVQAAAQGVSLGSALADLSAPLPYYRFSYTLQKALDVCTDLKALGAQLLAALEKLDAETLAATRANHEAALQNLVKKVRDLQVEEAEAAVNAMLASRQTTMARYQHYRTLLGADQLPLEPNEGDTINDFVPSKTAELTSNDDTGVKLIRHEDDDLNFSHSARDWQVQASAKDVLASILAMLPNLEIATKPVGIGISLHWGSQQLWSGLTAWGRYLQALSAQDTYDAARSGRLGSFIRREQDWTLQFNLSARELMQIDKQLAAARKRVDTALQEQFNQQTQIDNSVAIQFFLTTKFTNVDLYSWMQGEIGTVYTQAYELAYDAAKRAEQCYRFERGLTASNFIQFGIWDGLNRNLMAGERLHFALKQMERAYHEQNAREYELTRRVSLVSLEPDALIRLKETGSCEIELPESLFDLDFPGHYFRRIKTIALTVPCVVGPYENVSCTLRLLRHETRISSAPQPYPNQGEGDTRFIVSFASTEAIATSTGQNDSGLFELNFRDERYLPFEGAGAVSRWSLALNSPFQKFDHDTISDVIMHVRYTAREGGDRLKGAAVTALKTAFKQLDANGQSPLTRLFSLRHEFPGEWQRLWAPQIQGEPTPIVRTITLPLAKDRFPFYLGSASVQPTSIGAFAVAAPDAVPSTFTLSFVAAKGSSNEVPFDIALQPNPDFPSALVGRNDQAAFPKVDPDPSKDRWELTLTLSDAQFAVLRDGVRDLLLIVSFTADFGN